MSAVDIAGAVLWGLLSFLAVACLFTPTRRDLDGQWVVILVMSLPALIFCIARLCGVPL